MKLLTMEVVGFRAFKQQQRYEFSDQAGLFLLEGDNQLEPALGANGAGKSTFWDAVCWCLYGKTVRGIGAKHVETWGGRGTTKVSLEIELDGRVVQITRTRKPIALTLDGESVVQSVVDDLLAIGYQCFLQVCVLGQFGVLFADMRPTSRLDLISQVLGLDVWHQAAKIAAGRVKALDSQLREADLALHGAAVRVTTQDEALHRLVEQQESWAAEQAERKARLDAARAVVLNEIVGAKEHLRSLTVGAGKHESSTEQLEEKLAPLEQQCHAIERDVAVLRGEGKHLQSAHQICQARVAQLVGLGTGECPTCEQTITEEHFDATFLAAEDAEACAKGAFVGCQERTKQANRRLAAVRDDREAVLARLVTCEWEAKKAARLLTHARIELGGVEASLESVEAQVAASVVVENPHDAQVASLREAMALGAREHEAFEHDVFAVATELDLSSDWPRLFKELRLWMVDTALDELSIHVNSSLVALGLKRWTIEFVVERETESGTTSRGFDIFVHAPGSPKGVPWEAWSGGETQRLRVACAVGMSTLIRSRMPSAPQFEVWDEPTAHLDREGVRDMVSFFNDRAETRQVWLVDHRSLGSGAFDGTLTITKSAEGARWS